MSYGEVLGDKSTMHIRVTLTEGTSLYCDYFIWRVSCTVVVLTRFVMCGFCNVWGVFINMWVFCNIHVCVFVL